MKTSFITIFILGILWRRTSNGRLRKMPSRFMLLYGVDDGKLKCIDKHPDDFADPPEHEMSVTNLRHALRLLGCDDVAEDGQFDETLLSAFLKYLNRFGRVEPEFLAEDDTDPEKPLNELADKYGVFTWRYFDDDENGDVDHEKIIKMLNPDYGDELIKEKGGVPYDYRSTICYHYPWVPFQLTLRDKDDDCAKDDGGVSKYKITDTAKGTVLSEGDVVDNKIEVLLPDVEDVSVFVDGEEVCMNPVRPVRREAEAVDDDQIVETYWSYGDAPHYTRLEDSYKKDDGSDVWTSKCYNDLNLVFETKPGNDGKELKFTMGKDGQEVELKGIVSDSKVVFEKVYM